MKRTLAEMMLVQAWLWLLFAVLDLVRQAPVTAGFDLVIAAGVRLVAYQFARERRQRVTDR